ncbi:DUF805 domain-containing protein [Macrococcus sp. DPC7161]|uniref:DUF805 domain-containing protein n=1 Tax=Macrococcus sp. DPC7161 TaxID=2507060 RepID=UPI00100AA987|nr:DUF805 domain-containing protein [Macrococcus sp. DPC7161]RXK17904.1 DUF805 domain-containing protein [Macrococcus sp. DPC7161]
MEQTMTMREAFLAYWTKAFIFTGRARRREYWLSFLANVLLLCLISAVLGVTASLLHLGNGLMFWFMTIYSIITVVPNASILARRFHDVDIHGKYAVIITFVFFIYDMLDTFNVHFPLPEWVNIILFLTAFMTIITIFYITVKDGISGLNTYGEDTKMQSN